MMFRTHLAIGILSSIFINDYFHTGLLFSLVLIGSASLPDIDHQGSWLGRRLKPISMPINFIFGHRGITHSLLIPLLILALAINYGYGSIGLAVMLGYTTHIVSDSFTHEGVRVAYPFSKKIFSGPLKTNGIGEHFILGILAIAIGIKLLL